MQGHKPFMGADEYTVTAGFWTVFAAKVFGERYDQYAGRYHLTAYLWRSKWYITRLTGS